MFVFLTIGCTKTNTLPQVNGSKTSDENSASISNSGANKKSEDPKEATITDDLKSQVASKESVERRPIAEPTDWLQFRGKRNAGVSSAELPSIFDKSFVDWRAELIGRGASTPIIVGNKVFLTSYSGYGESLEKPGSRQRLKYHVFCFHREYGSLLWQRNIQGNLAETQRLNPNLIGHGFASSTMVSDGERVYAFFGVGGVFAFDMDGQFLWQQDVGWESHNFGSSASLALYENLLIVNASLESKSVYGLDKETGTGVWKIDNVYESWTTPVLGLNSQGHEELVIIQKNIVRGFDPMTGAELWTCEGILDYIVPTPVVVDGVAYCNGGKENRTLAIRLGGRGDVTNTHKMWVADVGSNVVSSVIKGDHIYQVNDKGVMQVLEKKTGEVVKRERIKKSGNVFGSPTLAGDKLLFPLIHGIAVVNASPELGLVALNKITDDEAEFRASIAISGDRMLTRNDNYIFCVTPLKTISRLVESDLEKSNEHPLLVSAEKYDFDNTTGQIRYYNRCLVESADALGTLILAPYQSVITEQQTADSLKLIGPEYPGYEALRLKRDELFWKRMKKEISEEAFLSQIQPLDKETIAKQAKLRMKVKAMFSKEQMDQHMAEHRAWLATQEKKKEEMEKQKEISGQK